MDLEADDGFIVYPGINTAQATKLCLFEEIANPTAKLKSRYGKEECKAGHRAYWIQAFAEMDWSDAVKLSFSAVSRKRPVSSD